ncbi:MAG: hypothetical protein Q9165_007289 [Trypethelium subeluteriae]
MPASEISANPYFAQQQSQVTPKCVIRPTNSQDVATAVAVLSSLDSANISCSFAVRSGGHSTVIGASNIQGGVTIDLGSIKKTSLDLRNSVASVGAGARWGSVYTTAEEAGHAVVGGRVSDVGVGGAISGVRNFEVVLADGALVNANSAEHEDLYLALKGGSNNFGIITRFDMMTFALEDFWGGLVYYNISQAAALLSAFSSFAGDADFDPRSAMILSLGYSAQAGFFGVASLFYESNTLNSSVFQNFTTAIPSLQNGFGVTNLTTIAYELGANNPNGLRQGSITTTIKPSVELLNDVYEMWNATVPRLASIDNLLYTLEFQPLPTSMLAAGAIAGGNSLGIDASDGPAVLVTLTTGWTGASADDEVLSTTRDLFQSIEAKAQAKKSWLLWKYLNYADITQDVFDGYGPVVVERLRNTSRRVDPQGLFQRAEPGNFKLFQADHGS